MGEVCPVFAIFVALTRIRRVISILKRFPVFFVIITKTADNYFHLLQLILSLCVGSIDEMIKAVETVMREKT